MNKNDIKGSRDLALKAGVWYVVSSVMVKAVTILTTPIFTRLMTTEEYGTVAAFTSWHSMLSAFFTLNLTYSIGRAKLDFPNKLDDYIGSVQLFSAAVSFGISVFAIIFLKPISVFLDLNYFVTAALIVYLFFEPTISFYQNSYKYTYKYKQNIAIAWYIVMATSSLSLVLMLALNGSRAHWRITGIILPTILLSIGFWTKSFISGHLHYNREYWKYGWMLSGPLILHTVSLNILLQSDRIFISKICGAGVTGIYSLAYNYSFLLSIITGAISEGWLPWFHDAYFANRFDEIRSKVQPLIILGCYIGLACIALAPEAILILGGKQYLEGINCVLPIALGVVCKYIYTHYVNIELHLKKTKYVSQGTIFAALLNIVLNAIFVPICGYVAAAYTTLASYVALLLVHFIITRRILRIHLYNDQIMFGALFVTGCIACVIVQTYQYYFIRYFLILTGFLSFTYFFRNYIISAIKKCLHKCG